MGATHNTVWGTIGLVQEFSGVACTFTYKVMEWIDDFLVLTSTNTEELNQMMKTILENNLARFGLTAEDPTEYVGLKLTKEVEGIAPEMKNPNKDCFDEKSVLTVVPLLKRRFQHAIGSQPYYQLKSLVESQLLRCIDCASTIRRAKRTMATTVREMYSLAYNGRTLMRVWVDLSNTYPYLDLDHAYPGSLHKNCLQIWNTEQRRESKGGRFH